MDPTTQRAQAQAFLSWLRHNTDTFDPVMVRVVLDLGGTLMDDDLAALLMDQYVSTLTDEVS